MEKPLKSLAELRVDYALSSLDEAGVARCPLEQFARWFAEAEAAEVPEPNAMVLATGGAGEGPSTRTVLLKAADAEGFCFFTNYESRKARELAAHPRASATFLWLPLQRQVHVEGPVERTSREESAAYFATRPYESQIGAHASGQSRPIPSRQWLEDRFAELKRRWAPGEVPLPENWGGYRLRPDRMEFWQGRRSRLHDRILYLREAGAGWAIQRLSP